VGITSQEIAERNAQHLAEKGVDLNIEAVPGLSGLGLDDAKAAEQALMDYHADTLIYNKYNSISPDRLDFADRLSEGYAILDRAGYDTGLSRQWRP
jgi:hypothetical protein